MPFYDKLKVNEGRLINGELPINYPQDLSVNKSRDWGNGIFVASGVLLWAVIGGALLHYAIFHLAHKAPPFWACCIAAPLLGPVPLLGGILTWLLVLAGVLQ
jgi:hypothetical protein